jgi:hypothetical protein
MWEMSSTKLYWNIRKKSQMVHFLGPYKISASYVDGFLNELQKLGLDKAAFAAAEKIGTA